MLPGGAQVGGNPGWVEVGSSDRCHGKVHFSNKSVYQEAPVFVSTPPKLSVNPLLFLSIFLLNLPSDLVS